MCQCVVVCFCEVVYVNGVPPYWLREGCGPLLSPAMCALLNVNGSYGTDTPLGKKNAVSGQCGLNHLFNFLRGRGLQGVAEGFTSLARAQVTGGAVSH